MITFDFHANIWAYCSLVIAVSINGLARMRFSKAMICSRQAWV
jgi:hypothetical protein